MSEVYVAGAWRTMQNGDVYIDGAWHRIVNAEVYVAGAWKDAGHFVDPLTASVSPAAANGYGYGYVTTNAVTVTPAGGLAPFTYVWAGGSVAHADSPTAATTSFTGAPGFGASSFETFTCTVTDAIGQTASVSVDVSLTDLGSFGGF